MPQKIRDKEGVSVAFIFTVITIACFICMPVSNLKFSYLFKSLVRSVSLDALEMLLLSILVFLWIT